VEVDNADESVFAFLRQRLPNEGGTHLIIAFNCTPVPRDHYVLGVPGGGSYRKILDSDDPAFGGSGYSQQTHLEPEAASWHDFPARLRVNLPPLAMVVWERVDG
jgi:1,4-alpha-glucan branching enzyme